MTNFSSLFLALLLVAPVANAVPSDSLRLATVQYPVEGAKTEQELFGKIEKLLKQAKEEKADLVLLPEWITLDTWPAQEGVKDRDVVKRVGRDLTPRFWKKLSAWAKDLKMIIAGASTAEKVGKKTYNTASVFFPDGRHLKHRKIYLTHWEKETGLSPGKKPLIFDTPWGKIALLICYDVEFPDLSVKLAKEDPSLLLVPSMTESPEGLQRVRWTAQARAVELTTYVVISGTVGSVGKDWNHFSRAAYLTPQLPGLKGIQFEAPEQKEGVWVQDLNMKILRDLKTKSHWRPGRQIRKF